MAFRYWVCRCLLVVSFGCKISISFSKGIFVPIGRKIFLYNIMVRVMPISAAIIFTMC